MLCTFDEFRESQHGSDAGGKGSMLASLYQSGHPVPNGFIILAPAFDDMGLRESAREKLLSLYHSLVGSSPIPEVAVRSSAPQEDSSTASFAGEFETVLNVATASGLIDAVQLVFASSRSDRVKSYTEAQHLPEIRDMAVVVQQMLAPSHAGVLFTVDPISGDTDTMQGNLTEGLGEQLVSGQITADTFTIHSPTGVYDGPDYFKPYQQDLFELATVLEKELHSPQDIEWAIEDEKLYLLQSRPITNPSPTPEVWNDTLHLDCLWTNTNIGEAMGGIVTPFSWSLIQELFESSMAAPVTPQLGRVAGRGYMNVSIIVSTLGKLRLSREFVSNRLAPLLGQIPDQMQIPAIKVTWRALLPFLAQQLGLFLRSLLTQKSYLKWVKEECPAWCETKFQEIDQCHDNKSLLEFYDGIELTGFKTFSMVVYFANQFLYRQTRLKTELAKILGSEDLETMLSGLGGDQQLQSMGPLMAISAMMKGDITREEFSRSYGHRGPMEAEFALPRTGEDPDWIDKLVSQWRDADLEDLLLRQQDNRDSIWKSLEQRSPRKSRRLRKLFSAAAEQAQNREYLRSEMVRQGWIVRRWVEKIAAVNHLEDDLYYLSKDEVVSFLKGDTSVMTRIEARKETFKVYSRLPPLPNIISGRFDPFQWSRDPNRRTDYFDAHHTYQIDDDDLIRGFPGSAGLIEGTVRVLESYEQMDEFLQGEILVTSFTNVGWTPLFPRAAAIITDIGAPLSHAAIVARELGIPAVVGAGSATMKLKTGDRVRVNGSEGIVELL
jgi:phosphohistidine swiveling domain-containing protein